MPDDFSESEPEESVFCIKLKDLELEPGKKLQMVYDFGCDHIFDIEVTAVEPMRRGTGRAYPKILSGEDRGILEDIPAFETLEIIRETDKNEKSDHYYLCGGTHEMIWDYRDYHLDYDKYLLKSEIEQIAEGYSHFEEFIEI